MSASLWSRNLDDDPRRSANRSPEQAGARYRAPSGSGGGRSGEPRPGLVARSGSARDIVDDGAEPVQARRRRHVGRNTPAGVAVARVVEHAANRPAQRARARLLLADPPPDAGPHDPAT